MIKHKKITWQKITNTFLAKNETKEIISNLDLSEFNALNEYHSFTIKKRNGKDRQIDSPSPLLKELQHRLLTDFLYLYEQKETNTLYQLLSSNITAYRPNYSIKDNVNKHLKKNTIVKIDLSSFFTTINRDKVTKVWSAFFAQFHKELEINNTDIFYYIDKCTTLCLYEGHLPQGASTSGYLANLAFTEVDNEINEYCKNHNLNYTRYSDDITISGDSIDLKHLLTFCNVVIHNHGFKINRKKTKILRENNRQIVTGVVLNKKRNIRRETKAKLRQEVYYLKKFKEDHIIKINFQGNTIDYLNVLLGKITWITNIELYNYEFTSYQAEISGIKALINVFSINLEKAYDLYSKINPGKINFIPLRILMRYQRNKEIVNEFLNIYYDEKSRKIIQKKLNNYIY